MALLQTAGGCVGWRRQYSTGGRGIHWLAGGSTSGELVEFRSERNNYRLLRPTTWEEASKAGADVLFQDPSQKSTNIGITVSPIRISSLDQFGDVSTVGQKLLATEKSKVEGDPACIFYFIINF